MEEEKLIFKLHLNTIKNTNTFKILKHYKTYKYILKYI